MLRLGLLLLALIPAAAHAEWRKAESPNFIVYTQGKEDEAREAAIKLERFHRVVRWASNVQKPEPPLKLRVFLVNTMNDVGDTMAGGGGGGVGGYYTTTIRGPIFVGTRYDPKVVEGVGAENILFHEYTHHLTYQYHPAAYPPWFTEGFAEFYGRTKLKENNIVEIGHAALNRYLAFDYWVPLNAMMTATSYQDAGFDMHALYSQGWLLVHYLVNSEERKGQLEQYLGAINAGQSFPDAMDSVFGPKADALNDELRKYSRQSRIPAVRIPFKPLEIGEIPVRTLSAAEDELIDEEIQLARGLLRREADDFAKKVRRVAERFPDDPYALQMLTVAEQAVDNRAAALAAVDRWLKVAPQTPRAMMHKAQLQIAGLQEAKSNDQEAWDSARRLLVQAHKLAPDDPMVLEAYYDSFTAEGLLPPEGAQAGLYRAFEIIPQYYELRHKLAADFEARGLIRDAIATIKPAAYDVHKEESEAERRRREKLEKKWQEVGVEIRESPREMLNRLEAKLAQSSTTTASAAN